MAKTNARAEVYFNLRKHIFSFRHRGRVIDHAPFILIYQPWFVVQEGGRKRVLKERQKNVHAFVCGEYDDITFLDNWEPPEFLTGQTLLGWKPARYNPYRSSTFEWTNSDTHNYGGSNWYPLHSAEWIALWVNHDNKPRMEVLKPR